MNLVQVIDESIAIGQPLPFSLRDEAGILLARKGYVIGTFVLGLLSLWGTFNYPMPDGSATPAAFTMLTLPWRWRPSPARPALPCRSWRPPRGSRPG